MRRLSLVLLGLLLAQPVLAQGRENDAAVEGICRPPLKFVAGACVPQCPAGYADEGRVCVFKSMRGGGGGN